jgi:hypothetical protein
LKGASGTAFYAGWIDAMVAAHGYPKGIYLRANCVTFSYIIATSYFINFSKVLSNF